MTYAGKGKDPSTIREWGGTLYQEVPTPVGLPSDAGLNEMVQYRTISQDLQFIQRVATIDGTDVIIPGCGALLGAGNFTYENYVYSTDGGDTFTTITDPYSGGSPAFFVTDSTTDTTYMMVQTAGTIGAPAAALRQLVTTINPFVAGDAGSAIEDVSATPCTALHDAISGGGSHYYTGVFGGPSKFVEYDIVGDTVTADLTIAGPSVSVLAYDGETAKYGDGFTRLYGTNSNGICRVELDGFTTEALSLSLSGTAPGGGSGWGTPYGGLSIDGASNFGYIGGRNLNNGRVSLIKFTLEPVGVAQYSYELSTATSYGVQSVEYDPATGVVLVLWKNTSVTYAGGWNEAHLTVLQDTGSAFTLHQDYVVPEELGGSAFSTGNLDYYYDPDISIINGKAFIPLNGGRENESGPFDLQNNVLTLDLSNPTATPVNVTVAPKTTWSPIDDGDLGYEEDSLRVQNIRGVSVNYSASSFESGQHPYSGETPRFNGDQLDAAYSPNLFDSNFFVGDDGVTGDYYDGGFLRRNTTNLLDLSLPERERTTSNGRDAVFHFIEGSVSKAANSLINRFEASSPNAYPIYGLHGDPQGSVSSYHSRSYGEYCQFAWDNENTRWRLINQWRPWEVVDITLNQSLTLIGGKVLCTISDGSVITVSLPDTAHHGDEVIFKDTSGTASSNDFNIRGGTFNIEDSGPTVDYRISEDYGWIHLRYNQSTTSWVIVSKSTQLTGAGTSQVGGIAPPFSGTFSSLADSANTDVDIVLDRDGYYTYTVNILARMDTAGTYLERRYTGSARRVSDIMTLQAAAVEVTGGWDGTGITVTISATGGNIRVNVANSSGEVVDGRVHLNYMVQDLIP